MTKTTWIGGKDKELMPEGYVAATYNLVENEIPVYFPEYYKRSVRTIYRTELPHRVGSLHVFINNVEANFVERGSNFQDFEIKELVKEGFLRFFYTPKDSADHFGDANLTYNKARTWINKKNIAIDADVINQIRIAIAAIENQLGLASTRWTGGSFTDTKITVQGIANIPVSYVSNIYAEETLYISAIFQEISDRLVTLANRMNVTISTLTPGLIVGRSLTPTWIETARTIINMMETVV